MNVKELRTARAQGLRPIAPGANLSGAYLSGANLWGANLLDANLSGANLRGANLRGAYLSGADLLDANLLDANLRDANLRDANLSGAYLSGADLRGAYLSGADLRGADLSGANLRGADLRGADLRGNNEILQITGMPSGQLILAPTYDGWQLRVGCWMGTLDELRAMIAQDEGWPEARGEEITRRRPTLQAALTLCEAHTALHPDLIDRLAEKWGTDAQIDIAETMTRIIRDLNDLGAA